MSSLVIVDNNDSVIGHADYESVHTNGLLHRFVLVYVFDKEGRFYLQKRAEVKPHGGLFAESLCAHVKGWEDYIDTAKRRMKEELGFSDSDWINLSELTKTRVSTEKNGWKNNAFVKIYECTVTHEPEINKSEVQDGHFYPLEKVIELFHWSPDSFVPGFKTTFETYLKVKKELGSKG
jgi:isopentenyl-diphosphate delta-isomerase